MTYFLELTDKVAIITGASSGIGEATARRLLERGARTVLLARRGDRLRALVDEFGPDRVIAQPGDVLDPQTFRTALEAAQREFRRCDIVVNNAGAFAVGPVEKIDPEALSHMVRVNVEAAYRVAWESIRLFKNQGSGHLVNISSIAGTKVPRAGIGWYAGTKHSLEALTESLRMECADTGVRVGTVEPGMVQTELFNEPITSIPRPLDAADIARAIEFMLSVPPHVTIPKLMVLPSCQSI